MRIKSVRAYWRRFYRKHREGCDLVVDFIGALSVFVFIFSLYFIGIILGG